MISNVPVIQSNPIQSEYESEYESNTLAHSAAPAAGESAKTDQFEVFWEAYPKKKSKGDARKAFAALKNVNLDLLLSALEEQKKSKDWLKEGGQFIPYPAIDKQDGYSCALCKNKGIIAYPEISELGYSTVVFRECVCMKPRRSLRRLEKSGLKSLIKDYTFARFNVHKPWQGLMLNAARSYAEKPEGWFFVGAQLKAAVTDEKRYAELINEYKTVDVLYIDDLFKSGRSKEAAAQPTSADINVAFEILNYRYNNPALLTVISSEYSIGDIISIDEAVGGRIYERTKNGNACSIKRDRGKNYRLRSATELGEEQK